MEIETRIWEQAGRFVDSANTLQEGGNLIPACVNAALAIELMFKSILSEKECFDDDFARAGYPKKVGGHILSKLFIKIKEEYRTDIKDLYHAKVGVDLTVELEQYNNYFMAGRYFYEQGAGSLSTGVINTAIKLQEVIKLVHERYAPKVFKPSDLGLSIHFEKNDKATK
ncbi:hypothetical protein [Pseudoalteromonas umbrosa]|uniref:hypothetical protein n=1 Tax=Pseudoalteromonas umbrosa TaxID=3048489 RepID=UPI0024C4211A|nr:hypothetical protein [Pseudoalteromonas sp. B95]MDK1289771.1 hypothetical protein [Pseudoalteromonas sp. B95]